MNSTDNTLQELFDSCLNNSERLNRVYEIILNSDNKAKFILRIFEVNRLYDLIYNNGKSWQDNYDVTQLISIFLNNKEEALKILKKYYGALKSSDILTNASGINEVKKFLSKYNDIKIYTINDIVRDFIKKYYNYLMKIYGDNQTVIRLLIIVLNDEKFVDDFIKKYFKDEKTFYQLKPYIISLLFGDCYLYCIYMYNRHDDFHYERILRYIDDKVAKNDISLDENIREGMINLQILQYAILFIMQKKFSFDLKKEIKEQERVQTLKKVNPLFLWD